jgi:hypothetical protein
MKSIINQKINIKFLHSGIVLILIIAIQSCATLPSQYIPKTFEPENENGMLIGSIAIKNEKPIFNGYMFYYTGTGIDRITPNKMIRINPEQIVKMKFKPDIFVEDLAIYFFSIQEPPGSFSFSNFRIFENGGYIQSSADIPTDISFELQEGKVTYLGEIHVDYNKGLIELRNQRERDLEILSEMFPNLTIE